MFSIDSSLKFMALEYLSELSIFILKFRVTQRGRKWKNGRGRGKQRLKERERESLYLLIYFPDFNGQGWGRSKLGVRNFISIFHVGCRAHSCGSFSIAFQG